MRSPMTESGYLSRLLRNRSSEQTVRQEEDGQKDEEEVHQEETATPSQQKTKQTTPMTREDSSTTQQSSKRTASTVSLSNGLAARRECDRSEIVPTRSAQDTPSDSQVADKTMSDRLRLQMGYQTSSSIMPSLRDGEQSPRNANETYMTSSIESLNAKLTISPQATITEGVEAGTADSPLMSPTLEYQNPLSRNSSLTSVSARRSGTRAARIPGMGPRRNSSRRSGSANPSVSPAHAFLSTWGNANTSEPPPEPKPDDEGQSVGLNNEYILGRTIDSGGFGTVKEIHSIDEKTGSRILRAVKIVRKNIEGKDERENEKCQEELIHEVSVWKYLRHRHILGLHVVYDTDFATYCVMDLNHGGTLYDILLAARSAASENNGRKGLHPRFAKRYAHQLASALRYLHEDIRVCHRDIKLENCLIDMSASDAATEGGNLRLCDFGLADFIQSEGGMTLDDGTASAEQAQLDSLVMADVSHTRGHRPTMSSVIGTLEYASPKGLSVSRKLFETAGDVWAFGVVVYALCTGELPFRHAMPAKTVELILQAEWDVEALRQAALLRAGTETPGGPGNGEVVIELVRGCLEMDVDLRLTIGEARGSAWFEGCESDSDEEGSVGW